MRKSGGEGWAEGQPLPPSPTPQDDTYGCLQLHGAVGEHQNYSVSPVVPMQGSSTGEAEESFPPNTVASFPTYNFKVVNGIIT